MNLIPNGKVFLDIDIHDPDRAMKIYSQIEGLEKEYGVLHAEYSVRGGLHIIVRRLKNLTLEQTISWWRWFLDCEIDNVHDLSRASFMVPSDHVIYNHPMFYDSMVEPIDLGPEAISEVMNQVDQDWKAKAPVVEPIDEITTIVQQAKHQSIAKGRSNLSASNVCANYHSTFEDNRDELLHLVDLIEDLRIDLTSREPDWFKLGIVCHNVLGAEEGREAFHRLSQFYPRYSSKETDSKFSHICRRGYSSYGIGTLVQLMSLHKSFNN